ncbi:MAG: Lipocalin-like protein [Bacteroidota bacterium]|nr:Lipocalin-like protein [Bacteroidota bacterium]
MKKYTLLVFLILFLLQKGYAQTTLAQLTEQEIKTMICHQWKLSYLEGKGKHINVPESVLKLYLGFKPDGSLYEIQGKKNYSGTWTYKHATYTIITDDQDGKENWDIVSITDKLLVVKTKFKGILVNCGLLMAD